ncbi:ribosome biogenesis GTP-binding protein YihA/YsxC [Candidatus Parabeggiatoa sp. HSG14]|uniref:ribosome biogenesis GTP-binding protein YihA/YsxC n=1 Tax=Candidatus Parabeggiatoa sp. HSG14 TaxID=3055593 RepID=UPI0025A7E794|nr:ribosome biogenesis GTP-binding protein YihA/YsxC [Thiotrichales bacterium HSG14]
MESATIYQQADYLLSAHTLEQLPDDIGSEVAFAGRSNSGKSSAINAITRKKSLARTSKTPGRTQQIIFFKLDDAHCLVDLPGYGYAKVPLAIKQHWQKTLERYLLTRRCLHGLILMMDIRHPLTEFDQQMLNWCSLSNMPVHILLTKADKLSRGKGSIVLQQVRKHLANLSGEMSVQLFSALKRTGIEEVQTCLTKWFNYK